MATYDTPWGAGLPTSTLTGQPDYLQSLQSSGVGFDIGSATDATGGNWLSNLMGSNSNFLGTTQNGVTTQGWGGTALGVAQGIGNAWMGMQQYGLAKDQLNQSKKQFDLNYAAQQKTTNASLEDRQAARVASNAGAYQSVADYMKKNGI